MCHSLAAIFFLTAPYIRTDETDETASGRFCYVETGFGSDLVLETVHLLSETF